jgi:hypothetical protein
MWKKRVEISIKKVGSVSHYCRFLIIIFFGVFIFTGQARRERVVKRNKYERVDLVSMKFESSLHHLYFSFQHHKHIKEKKADVSSTSKLKT